MPPWETKKALILVRTYPTPATNGVEVSCTAAVTEDGKWLRLFPIPYRFLDPNQRFSKYQWIEASMKKASDSRPESYKLDYNSIKTVSDVLSTKNDWAARKKYVDPLKAHCLCCLKKERDEKKHPTLGIFRPKSIKRLEIKAVSPNWTQAELDILRHIDLFRAKPKEELEKVPYEFRYEFNCDEDSCPGHKFICTDWEMGQAWRSWSKEYADQWEEKFRQRFEKEMIEKYDTHFYVGTVHQHPGSWIIVGLFYPPKSATGSLFDS
jgi:hypothetical protein